MSIIVVEVPHRGPASAWSCYDRDEYVRRINDEAERRSSDWPGSESFAECVEWAGEDLAHYAVIEGPEQAATYLESGDSRGCAAAEREMRELGWLDEDEDEEEG